MKDMGVLPGDGFNPWQRLVRSYSEPHRHYHNLRHIIHTVAAVKKESWQIRLCAFYHGIVYDPTRDDNEVKSTERLFSDFPNLSDYDKRVCYTLITNTKTHSPGVAFTEASHILNNADLAILASGKLDYSSYAKNIRREYSMYSDDEYILGRLKVLDKLWNRAKNYTLFHNNISSNEAAMCNMEKESRYLRGEYGCGDLFYGKSLSMWES